MRTLLQMFFLGVGSVIVGMGINQLASEPIPLFASPDDFLEKVPEEHAVHIEDLSAMYDAGDVIFIDARSADAFGEGHIPGALSIPFKEFDEGTPELVEALPFEEKIVIYCDGADCQASKVVHEKMLALGFSGETLKIFSGGWAEWLKARPDDIETGG